MRLTIHRGPFVWAVALLAPLALLAAGCGSNDDVSGEPAVRTFYMEAMEPKGSASVEKEAFPDVALPEGGGYVLKEPNAEGKWEVETYTWNPKQIVVTEGDTVNLEILGVNGARHEGSIGEYVESFIVERGKLTSLSFVADRAGVFTIGCATHQPSMTAELVVLPRS